MTVLYIDVSHHDWTRHGGNLDWGSVRDATSPCMVARATYGDPSGWHRDSPHFGDFQHAAMEAGFTLRGGYHNLVRGDPSSIARQVDWLRRELDNVDAEWAMCDVEPYAELVAAGLVPGWAHVQYFHDRWYQVESRPMAWYIPRWFWAKRVGPSLGEPDLRGLKGPLIQSHYAGGDGTAGQIYANAGGDSGTGWDDFYGGRLPDLWQYTNTADVPGASTSTGANAFRGTFDQLYNLLTGGDPMSALSDDEQRDLYRRVQNLDAWMHQGFSLGQAAVLGLRYGFGNGEEQPPQPFAVNDVLARLAAKPPVAPTPVDPEQVRAAVKATLEDPDILGLIAGAVLDEAHRRTARDRL